MTKLRSILPPCLLLLSLLLAACGGEEEPERRVTISDAGPTNAPGGEAAFLDLDGEPVSLADFRGHKVILNYWATWCAPCIEEIPALLRAEEALADEDYVLLLASDERLEQIREFLEERDFGGNFVKLQGSFASQGVEAVPSTILYDSQGNQVESWLGAREWDSPEMLEALRQ